VSSLKKGRIFHRSTLSSSLGRNWTALPGQEGPKCFGSPPREPQKQTEVSRNLIGCKCRAGARHSPTWSSGRAAHCMRPLARGTGAASWARCWPADCRRPCATPKGALLFLMNLFKAFETRPTIWASLSLARDDASMLAPVWIWPKREITQVTTH